METGKMIVSTRGDERKGIMLGGLSVYAIVGICAMWSVITNMKKGEEVVVICSLGLFLGGMLAITEFAKRLTSYLEVYETCVLARTMGSMMKQTENVQLKYMDITNISVSGNLITIYTPYTQYQISVQKEKKKEQDIAVDEIRKRMGTGRENEK